MQFFKSCLSHLALRQFSKSILRCYIVTRGLIVMGIPAFARGLFLSLFLSCSNKRRYKEMTFRITLIYMYTYNFALSKLYRKCNLQRRQLGTYKPTYPKKNHSEIFLCKIPYNNRMHVIHCYFAVERVKVLLISARARKLLN